MAQKDLYEVNLTTFLKFLQIIKKSLRDPLGKCLSRNVSLQTFKPRSLRHTSTIIAHAGRLAKNNSTISIQMFCELLSYEEIEVLWYAVCVIVNLLVPRVFVCFIQKQWARDDCEHTIQHLHFIYFFPWLSSRIAGFCAILTYGKLYQLFQTIQNSCQTLHV